MPCWRCRDEHRQLPFGKDGQLMMLYLLCRRRSRIRYHDPYTGTAREIARSRAGGLSMSSNGIGQCKWTFSCVLISDCDSSPSSGSMTAISISISASPASTRSSASTRRNGRTEQGASTHAGGAIVQPVTSSIPPPC